MLNGSKIQVTANQTHRNYKYRRLSRSDSEDDQDDESEEIELLNRSTKGKSESGNSFKLFDYDTLFDRPIQEGESLASISLKYRISVADLKRVNKLEKETEFYALNSLKIPVKNNSALYEVLQEELNNTEDNLASSVNTLEFSKISSSSELENNDRDSSPFGVISISQICREKQTKKEARQFLENMQKDLQKIQEKTNSYKGSLNEASSTLTRVSFSSIDKKNMFDCNDKDLSWWRVLCIGSSVVVGVPLLYLLISLYRDSYK